MNLIDPEKILTRTKLEIEPLLSSHASVIYKQLQTGKALRIRPSKSSIASIQGLESRYLEEASRFSPNRQEIWLNWVMRLQEFNTYVGLLEVTAYAANMIFSSWQQGYANVGCDRVLRYLFQEYKSSHCRYRH